MKEVKMARRLRPRRTEPLGSPLSDPQMGRLPVQGLFTILLTDRVS